MFEKMKAKFREAIVDEAIAKMIVHIGQISSHGYPKEAQAIRLILKRIVSIEEVDRLDIAIKKNEKPEGESYEYFAMNSRGAEVTGVLSAKDQPDAVQQIRSAGLFPTMVRERSR